MHEEWGFMPALYEPAIPEYGNLPEGPFDGIDAMEHIFKEVIPSVFEYIYIVAQKFVFLGICTRPKKGYYYFGQL